MKKILVVAVAILASAGFAFAQKNKVITAYNAHESYKREKDPAELTKAKQNIDDATAHEDTKGDAKTWVYRGNIYLSLFKQDFTTQFNAIKDVTDASKKRSMAYANTSPVNITEAANAYLKAKSIDTKQGWIEQITIGLADCYAESQNQGISLYNQEKYADALPLFELANSISVSGGVTDTAMILNAALSAQYAKMYDKAITYFQKLTTIGYGQANTWLLLAECFQAKGDTVGYQNAITDGMKKYPSDAGLLSHDVDIKLKQGKNAEAVAELEALITSKPNDPDMYFIVGNVYDQMANPTGPDGKPAEKPANYTDYFDKAAANYKKAIELDPNHLDATYNIGVLYYNQGVEYYNRANSTIADAAKYGTMWEDPLKVAITYLEKAWMLDPKDINTMRALQQAYGMLGDTDNYNKMKEEIKKAQGQ